MEGGRARACSVGQKLPITQPDGRRAAYYRRKSGEGPKCRNSKIDMVGVLERRGREEREVERE